MRRQPGRWKDLLAFAGRITKAGSAFKSQLLLSFLFVSILPFQIIQWTSYYSIAATMRENVNELIDVNLHQTRKSLDTVIASYEDFLFQIYTDDEIVEQLNNLNAGRNPALSVNVLRRRLSGFAGSRPVVQCVTLITPEGKVISYDKLSSTTLESSWLGTDEEKISRLYGAVAADKAPTIFAERKGIWFAGSPYYLFHIGHRVIDYRRIFNDIGIIIISLDESLLAEICNDDTRASTLSSVNFIVDADGALVSFPERTLIGSYLAAEADPHSGYRAVIRGLPAFDSDQVALRSLLHDRTGWTIVSAADLSALVTRIQTQQRITAVIGLAASAILVGIIFLTTNRLSASVLKVSEAMQLVGGGDLSMRIRPDDKMPQEIKVIAGGFNEMLGRLTLLVEEVKEVSEKQKETEIRFLEAQINPHFLYNTLDTINWMAIDREEYEISDMVTSLARILRYGVDKGKTIVTVGEELQWLREYILLQQTRLKYSFSCKIAAPEEVLDCRLHKLLLQPFVENAIIHGFAGRKKGGELKIEIDERDGRLAICIADNGRGLPPELVDRINRRQEFSEDAGIGIDNARHRLRMYYGEGAGLLVESGGEGTKVLLSVPVLQEGRR